MSSEPASPYARWAGVLRTFGVPEAVARSTSADLAARCAGPGRHYHTLDHVAAVLRTITAFAGHARDLPTVELAAWFHDAVYDPRAADNEEQSAAYAGHVLAELGIPAATITAVGRLILLTKNHQAAPDDRDGHLLLDADLAILGAEPAEYATYAAAIRQEYAWVPEPEYRAGRTRILQSFLQRDRLYFLSQMAQALEARARTNLADEIARLTGNPGGTP